MMYTEHAPLLDYQVREVIILRQSEFVTHPNDIPIIGISYHNIPPREANLPLKCYHTLRITYVRQGRGVWRIGDSDFQIEQGDIFIFNNSEFRAIRTIFPPDHLQLTVIDFEPRLIWSDPTGISDSKELKLFFDRRISGFQNRIPADAPVSCQLRTILEEMEAELFAKLPEYQPMLIVKLMNMLILLNRHFSDSLDQSPEAPASHGQFTLISRIMQYIDDHLVEDISREHLADHFHIHPSTLSKLFSYWNGLGLNQYISRKKIYVAVQLLSQRDLSVLDIAIRCGFNNTANFYKAFKRVTGGVPSDYR
ncbi:helix-turn-helix transcriptional regulator [Paenibacillus qinlingensis]|uniref:helix-turn-helix transcriptional regulator n=1 Tax=Paenibacillus qinlingensis TaxID=1837343 RepID=UPI001565DC34|nr:AraC family transcriptional regulator [Paenibacillus qinlingensis]NQX60727.1 helix-turn-helix transcriptional regulator [Paenibacillus qinlingensis]